MAAAGRTLFIGLSLWMDFFFFDMLRLAWFAIAKKCRVRRPMAVYHFVFICCVCMGAWLNIKYQVLSRFNDTINFLIIRNLGGGSLMEAFAYVSEEAASIGIFGLAIACVYWIGLRIVRRITESAAPADAAAYPRVKPWAPLLMIAITIALCFMINSRFELRYGLARKTAYQIVSTVFDTLTDIDRDGFGAFSFPLDPAPMNSAIYPGALDIPGNGIDENGYGGDFILEGETPDGLAGMPSHAGDHILLIVLESARSDVIGKIWEGRPVAPHMDALAKAGTAVAYAYSHTGYTITSITALFNRTLSDGRNRMTLVDYLEKAGYQLSFISGQDESFGNVASNVGMTGKGRSLFDARSAIDDRVFSSKAPGSLRLSEARIVQQFNLRSGEVDWHRPQFFYLNLQAAHFPYSHPKMPAIVNDKPVPRSEIQADNRKWLEATYYNAIAVADQTIGALVDRLKSIGAYENTTIMILGDHGESLFDDGFLGHGHALNETQTRIPLIINRSGLDIHCAVGQTDMAELLAQVALKRFDPEQWKDPEKGVLQVVGNLRNPRLIGIVSQGEKRTVLDMRTRRVFLSDQNRWESFDPAWNDPQLAPRVKALVRQWETACWENHLSLKNSARQNPVAEPAEGSAP